MHRAREQYGKIAHDQELKEDGGKAQTAAVQDLTKKTSRL
jgi:hypothetical protein